MNKCIYADALIDFIQKHDYMLVDATNSHDKGMFTCGIIQAINEQPTVDVVEVVHGKNIGGGAFECSVCGFRDNYHDYEVHFCPNCGAKMDTERREDDEG